MKKARVPSTICTSALAACLALTPFAATAQRIPEGCFTRVYSDAHLAGQPAQVVAAMWVNFWHDDKSDDAPSFRIDALMADQGHARRDGLGGRIMGESGYCTSPDYCAVFCDGGNFAVTRDTGDMIEITTDHLRLVAGGQCGEGVTAVTTLAERPGQPTTYRRYRADPVACARNE